MFIHRQLSVTFSPYFLHFVFLFRIIFCWPEEFCLVIKLGKSASDTFLSFCITKSIFTFISERYFHTVFNFNLALFWQNIFILLISSVMVTCKISLFYFSSFENSFFLMSLVFSNFAIVSICCFFNCLVATALLQYDSVFLLFLRTQVHCFGMLLIFLHDHFRAQYLRTCKIFPCL